MAQHTLWLDAAGRAAVDAQVGPRLRSLGDRQVEAEVKRLAYRLDPAGFVARARRAESERTVTLRPAPDTMTYLSALLPVASGGRLLRRSHRGSGEPGRRG